MHAEVAAVHAELHLKAECALVLAAVHAEAWTPEQKKDAGPAEMKK